MKRIARGGFCLMMVGQVAVGLPGCKKRAFNASVKSEDATAPGSAAVPFSPNEFAILFPAPERSATGEVKESPYRLALSSLITPEQFAAVEAHMRHRAKLRASNASGPLDAEIEALQFLWRDRADLVAENPAYARLFGPSFAFRECVSNFAAWQVVAVRFEPYEQVIVGPMSGWRKWEEANGKQVRRAMHLRFVAQPICNGRPADAAVHLAYVALPSASAAPALRNGILAGLAWTKESLTGRDSEAKSAFDKHVEALNSPEYAVFRKATLARWNQLARLRTENQSWDFSGSDTVRSRFVEGMDPTIFNTDVNYVESAHWKDQKSDAGTRLDISHPGLRPQAAAAFFEALKSLVAEIATPENRQAITTFAATSEPNNEGWVFGSLNTREGWSLADAKKATEADRVDIATKAYAQLSPSKVTTFGVDFTAPTPKAKIVSEWGFFQGISETSGKVDGPEDPLRRVLDTKAFFEVDYAFRQNGANSRDRTQLNTALKSNADISRFVHEPESLHVTSTSCTSCHLPQKDFVPSIGGTFRMLGLNTSAQLISNPLTWREVERTAKAANAELGL